MDILLELWSITFQGNPFSKQKAFLLKFSQVSILIHGILVKHDHEEPVLFT